MANNLEYKHRIADQLLMEELDAMGAVLIEGPKACGKTTTAEQQAKSILYMDDPEYMDQNLQLAETNIKLLLQGGAPRLIDEWDYSMGTNVRDVRPSCHDKIYYKKCFHAISA